MTSQFHLISVCRMVGATVPFALEGVERCNSHMFRSKGLKVSWVTTERYAEQEIKRYPRNANRLKKTQSHFSATCPS